MVNWEKIRRDFPILKKIIYLDNAATCLTPLPVVEKIQDFYLNYRVNVHRGVYRLSTLTTEMYIKAHKTVAKFIDAVSPEEIVFTYNTTYGINMIAYSLKLKKQAKIVTTPFEHHSNLLPWQYVSKRVNGRLEFLETDEEGNIDMAKAEQIIDGADLVAITMASNVFGNRVPVEDIIKIANENNAITLLDGAQAVGHFPVSVRKLKCDFMVFSGHKGIMGPMGIGVIYCSSDILEQIEPSIVGGGMVEDVWLDRFKSADMPEKLEAGTPNVAGAIGLAEAAAYIMDIGIENIEKREKKLLKTMLEGLIEIDKVDVYGPTDPDKKNGLVAFNIRDMEPFEVGVILDQAKNIAVRTGHHCAMPLHKRLHITGSVRASLHAYNNEEDIRIFLDTVSDIAKNLS